MQPFHLIHDRPRLDAQGHCQCRNRTTVKMPQAFVNATCVTYVDHTNHVNRRTPLQQHRRPRLRCPPQLLLPSTRHDARHHAHTKNLLLSFTLLTSTWEAKIPECEKTSMRASLIMTARPAFPSLLFNYKTLFFYYKPLLFKYK